MKNIKSYLLLSVFPLFFFMHHAVGQDQLRFGKPVPADTAEISRNTLPLSTASPPRELANNAEVIVVSGYEPSNAGSMGTKVRVVVDRPGSNVILVLTSYEKVTWHVDASPSTKVKGIIAGGYNPLTVVTTLQTTGYTARLPYAYEVDNINFRRLLSQLNQWLGVSKIDAFQGKYSIPSLVTVSRLDPPRAELTADGYAPEAPKVNFEFPLLTRSNEEVRWTLTGPVANKEHSYRDDGKVAIANSKSVGFVLKGDKLEIVSIPNQTAADATLPANFPRFSWATDVAYDSRHDIATVVSFGGEGYLYRFDAKNNRWLDFRSLNNIDIYSLAYDRVLDRYVAWTDSGELLFISSGGDPLFRKKVIDRLPGFGRLYDRGNERAPRITIAPQGDNIALVYISGGIVRNIWHYDVKTHSAALTYQRRN